MFPPCISAGISYSDFWIMTVGEIESILQFTYNRKKAEAEAEMQQAAFIAYFSGAYGSGRVKIPSSLDRAFPRIFGREADGNISVSNYKQGADALKAWADRFNERKKAVT